MFFSPFCIIITGDRADGGGEINSLKSVQKCLIANKSAEHVYCARRKSKQCRRQTEGRAKDFKLFCCRTQIKTYC